MKNNNAFTLVELSIVLVIIGLIVGGVVGGQALITSGRMHSFTQELTKYETAYNSFQLQYDAIPGDMPDAYDYWGVAAGCANHANTGGCNGNGNNRLEGGGEAVNIWLHLSNAKIVPGEFSVFDNSPAIQPGVNCPFSKAYKSAAFIGLWQANGNYTSQAGNVLFIGGTSVGGSVHNRLTFISPKEAYAIDKKIDDGLANSGRLGGGYSLKLGDTNFYAYNTYRVNLPDAGYRLHYYLD